MNKLKGSDVFWTGFGVIAVLFMLSPIVLVVLFSFGDNKLATLPIGTPTLRWYQALFANPNFISALHNSAIITLSVGLISTVVGTLAALAFASWGKSTAEAGMLILSLPIMAPPLVLGLALATSFSSLGLPLGVYTVIPSHLVFTQPFVILVVYAQVANFDFTLTRSARDLGASPWHAFWTIMLPLLRPTIIGAALIAMSISLDDFVITFFTLGNGLTLPTLVWGMLRTGLNPTINALGSLILLTTIGSSVIALGMTRYRG